MLKIRWEDEIGIRIVNLLKCTAVFHKMLLSKLLSRATKIRVYKTVIRRILMYGSEPWTLTLTEENKLLLEEQKVIVAEAN